MSVYNCMAGSFSTTSRIFGYGATPSNPVTGTLSYATDYRDADHVLCRQDVEICKVIDVVIIGEEKIAVIQAVFRQLLVCTGETAHL